MKRLLLVAVLLLLAAPAFAQDGYQVVTYWTSGAHDTAVGGEVIPIECGTASSWGSTSQYKTIRMYDCNDQPVGEETCWRWLFGAWRQQYC